MNTININKNRLILYAFMYCYVPIILFFIGWLKWYVALLVLLCLGGVFFSFYKNKKDSEGTVCVSLWVAIIAGCFIFGMSVLCGMGHFYPQSADFMKHNSVLSDLTTYSWPVVYEEFEPCMLTYYVGQYLFPAFVGKMVHSVIVSEWMMLLWGAIGIYIVWLLTICMLSTKQVWQQIIILLMLFGFSGMLFPLHKFEQLLTAEVVFSPLVLRSGSLLLEFRSLPVQLQWVPNQCICTWMACLMFYKLQNQPRYWALILLPILLVSPWCFIALMVYVLTQFVINLVQKNKALEIFSWENCCVALIPGVFLVLYYWGNVMLPKPDEIGFGWAIGSMRDTELALLFVLFMFGVYYLIIPIRQLFSNSIYYSSLAMLLVIPLFKMGKYNDWVSCVSMVPVFYTFLYVINFLFLVTLDISLWIRKFICIVFIMVGLYYPISYYWAQLKSKPGINHYPTTLSWYTDRNNDEHPVDLRYNYYTYDMENSFFCKHLMKKDRN